MAATMKIQQSNMSGSKTTDPPCLKRASDKWKLKTEEVHKIFQRCGAMRVLHGRKLVTRVIKTKMKNKEIWGMKLIWR